MIKYILLLLLLIDVSCASGSITSIYLKNKSGSAVTNYPLTLGHVFKHGDVVSGKKIVLYIGGSPVNVQQFDLKTKYSDGSARFAIISAIIPFIQESSTTTIDLEVSDLTASSGEMTKQQILDTNIQANIALANLSDSEYTGGASVNLRDAIASASNLNYWLKGPACTEILIDSRFNNSLNASWEARFYPGTNYIRVSHTVENVESSYRGNVSYDVSISQGISSSVQVFAQNVVTHYKNGRWRKVLWVGEQPPDVEVHYDIAYLCSTGHIPNYDSSLVVPEATLAGKYTEWLNSPQELMGNSNAPYSGVVMKSFPTGGAREDIGPLPAYSVRYLLSFDNRMKKIMQDSAEKAAAAPFHWRESDSSKTAYGHVLTIDDRPTVWTNEYYIGLSSDYRSGLPNPIGSVSTGGWSFDQAHQPSFAFVPYLVTGDKFYLDEMNYIAAGSLSEISYSDQFGRNYSNGWLTAPGIQIRGAAWAGRNIAHAAALGVDGSFEKLYFTNKINNAIAKWNTDISLNYPLGNMSYDPSCTGGAYNLAATTKYCVAPWMEDYLAISLKMIDELGYSTSTIRSRHKDFIVGRLTNPSFNPYDGIVFHFPVILQDGNAAINTWEAAKLEFVTPSTSYASTDSEYKKIALATLAVVYDYSGASSAYSWLKNLVYNASEAAIDPTWSIIPRVGFSPPVDGGSPSSCYDSVQNGDETGVDCGGSCPVCAPQSFGKRYRYKSIIDN